MERIDETMVRHIAGLSRLALTDDEITRYTQELGAILEYASHLPALRDHEELGVLRAVEDTEDPTSHPEQLLVNALALENGFIKVPAILDKSDV